MDATIATIIIAVVSGIFGIITVKIQKDQKIIVDKIDEQNVFIEKEKAVWQKIMNAEKKRDMIVEQITVLLMQINIQLLHMIDKVDARVIDDIKVTASELENSYSEISDEITDLNRSYDILMDVKSDIQKDIDNKVKKRSSK